MVEAEGVAHIKATFNNTLITIADMSGNVITWASAGKAVRLRTTKLIKKNDVARNTIRNPNGVKNKSNQVYLLRSLLYQFCEVI